MSNHKTPTKSVGKKTPLEIIEAIIEELGKSDEFISSGQIATKMGSNSSTVSKYLVMVEKIQKLPRLETAKASSMLLARIKKQ